ncbi:MAG: DUF3131 domain-containing protein [Candidatus Thiothrix putei]|uniref:DUF3131 domain-containing protein n=1 Tax=Candidatus Thiothrix putei TaxID=3080811 RepID=A0AA95H9X2_9GAMM|nr:MAG: DUF3131 domain-containing protein [Candidatus Thiothrix putei]
MLRLSLTLALIINACGGLWLNPAIADAAQPSKPTYCPARAGELNERDKAMARIAWQYFENNLQAETGLVNAADQYPSTTLWDVGSTLAAFIAAEKLGIIPRERFDRMTSQMLDTLRHLDLFNGEAPNKVYNTKTAQKVDYRNQPSAQGIGVSTLDLGRLVSWLNILSCLHPQHQAKAQQLLESWSFCRLLEHNQMYGLAFKDESGKVEVQQEGRLGYEQYAGKAFQQLGFDMSLSARYHNQYATQAEVSGVELLVDSRDASTLGAHNYVVSESYAMDVLEHGLDEENKPLLEAIYTVQQRRWEQTGRVTAVSEDNLDRKPYFVYNTIFSDDIPWAAITDKGEDMSDLRSLSVKAAVSMAYLFPEREYSKVLLNAVKDARNPKGGWYSGIYEDPVKGFNKATTANTNGVILSVLLHKLYGSLNRQCDRCGKGVKLSEAFLRINQNKRQCLAEGRFR